MKVNIPFIAVLLAVMILASSCASFRPLDKASLLKAELEKWENFSSDGIFQASHEGFTLRKIYILNKTKDELRLDVVDGGVFGINPNPLISVYLGDYLAITSPTMPQLEVFAALLPDPGDYLKPLGRPDSLFAAHGREIMDTGKLALEGIELAFSENMQLDNLTKPGSGIRMDISYTKHGIPDKVRIVMDENTSLELLVDNISYGKAELETLPPNEDQRGMEELIRYLEGMFPNFKGEEQ
jgi:hypothetical protein